MNSLKALWIALRVGVRRLFRGRRRPSWSWKYESFIDILRASLATPMAGREQRTHELMDQFGMRQLRPGLANYVPQDIDGVPGLWVEPLQQTNPGMILYLHGGGYVIGSFDSHRPIMTELSHRTNMRLLGINYRLAREACCPAAIEDVVKVYQTLLETNDPTHMLIVGDSAGGGLAVTSMVAIRDEQLPLPAGAVLFSPWTDFTVSGASVAENATYDYLREEGVREGASSKYYRGDLDAQDPRVSPIFADLHGLPPMLIMAGGAEVLLDDSRELARRATEAGTQVELHIEPDEVHVYPILMNYSPNVEQALQKVVEFIHHHVPLNEQM